MVEQIGRKSMEEGLTTSRLPEFDPSSAAEVRGILETYIFW
jgi:hypothetical protein